MRITICCQDLFCRLFYSRLTAKKKKRKKSGNTFMRVMNGIDQTIGKLIFSTFFKSLFYPMLEKLKPTT